MRAWIDLLGLELSAVSWKEKVLATLGGFVALLLLILMSERGLNQTCSTAVVASMGASAVLLFAVPHGQLSQPWPVVGGHVLSALIGVTCAKWIPLPEVAAAAAVGLSIGVMHQFRCIHPPGGATALTAVLTGEATQGSGYGFVLFPVLTNALAIVVVGVLFNYAFPWRRYPAALIQRARARRQAASASTPTHEEVVAALRRLDSFVDITEDDLIRLVEILNRDRISSLPTYRRSEVEEVGEEKVA